MKESWNLKPLNGNILFSPKKKKRVNCQLATFSFLHPTTLNMKSNIKWAASKNWARSPKVKLGDV